jgi:hypothetical protein
MTRGDITGPFFDRLDEMLGSGKKLSDLRAFLAPYREQFEALERDAKAKNEKGALKKAKAQNQIVEEENERLKTQIQEQYQVIEKLSYDVAQFKKTEKEEADSRNDEDVRREPAVRILLELNKTKDGLDLGTLSQLLNDMTAGAILHYLNQMKDTEFVLKYSGSPTRKLWSIMDKGESYLKEQGLI